MRPDRRKFIKDTICAALGGVSVYSALGQMQLLQAATRAATFTDYKALVCVFLYGGNDGFNTIVPYTASAYNAFYGSSGVRPNLALTQASLHQLTAAPGSGPGSPGDGILYGLHPSMPELATLFNNHNAAIVANVGTLMQPTTQQNAWDAMNNNSGFPLPPQLFSHADQAAYWQSSPPTNQPITGWGGRIADLVAGTSTTPILTGLNGQDAFMRGASVDGYLMGPLSAVVLDTPYDAGGPGIDATFAALHAQGTQFNVLERAFAARMNHSTGTASLINGALGAARPPSATYPNPLDPANSIFASYFPNPTGDLDSQLQTVAELIWAANNVSGYSGPQRQVFFVNTGGYDTHSNELATHAGDANNVGILALLSKSLAGFYNALASKGLASQVTAFTASDFGRSLTSNDNGTDHGWGGHHFVVGGAVQGGKFYGNGCNMPAAANFGQVMPSLVNPNTFDVNGLSLNRNDPGDGYGRLIPTTSVEQYGATLAKWFGLSASDIDLVFPNLGNFPIRDLGFMG